MFRLEDCFIVPDESKPVIDDIVLNKLKKGERVNVLFATPYYTPNYYDLAEFISLSAFFSFDNVHFYIFFADLDLSCIKHEGTISLEELSTRTTNRRELNAILFSLGAKEENIHFYDMSEAWLKLLKNDNKKIFAFVAGLLNFHPTKLKLPTEWCKIHYRPKNFYDSIPLLLRKYVELLLSAYFHQIYPEDIDKQIDIIVTGHGASPLFLNLKRQLVGDKAISNYIPACLITLPIPCFGRGFMGEGGFIIPNWNMTLEEIYGIINKCHVPSRHIKQIFKLLLNKQLKTFDIMNEKNQLIVSNEPPKLSCSSINAQRLILAHNLFRFLNEFKNRVYLKPDKEYVIISKEKDLLKTGKILNSKVALKILLLSNGQFTISEIAKKLNKHTSNVSKIISDLKKNDLIKINNKGKVEKIVKTLKINL